MSAKGGKNGRGFPFAAKIGFGSSAEA